MALDGVFSCFLGVKGKLSKITWVERIVIRCHCVARNLNVLLLILLWLGKNIWGRK